VTDWPLLRIERVDDTRHPAPVRQSVSAQAHQEPDLLAVFHVSDPFANLPVRSCALGHACPTCGSHVLRLVAYYHGLTHCLIRCTSGHWFVYALDDAQPVLYGRGTRVLVVEPDDRLRDLYCMRLAPEFLDVKAVSTRSEAIRATADWRPVVVTTELTLPDGSALEWCRHLKRSTGTSKPAILIVTGNRRPELLAEAANAADAVLIKPCQPDVYLREVLRLVGYEAASSSH
jgi:CheY-like chemotaxis protein